MISVVTPFSGLVKLWRISDTGRNKFVKSNDRLALITVVNADGVEVVETISSPCHGTLMKIICPVGDRIEVGDVVAEIEPCRHPALYNSMCVSCGDKVIADKKATMPIGNTIGSASVAMSSSVPVASVPFTMASGKQLQLSTAEAER